MEQGLEPPLNGVFLEQASQAERAIYAQLDPEATRRLYSAPLLQDFAVCLMGFVALNPSYRLENRITGGVTSCIVNIVGSSSARSQSNRILSPRKRIILLTIDSMGTISGVIT